MRAHSTRRFPVRPRRTAGLAALLALPAAAAAVPTITGPPNARLTDPVPPPLATVDNGDLARGLDGWAWEGRDTPPLTSTPEGPEVGLVDNTTLVTPAFTVPPGGQAITVTLREPGGGGLLEVRARPVDGTPEVPLATLEPDPRRRALPVGLAGLAGRTVRLVLDPVTSLGRTVQVGGLGPVQTVVPGWDLRAGTPVLGRSAGRPALLASDGRLAVESSPFATGPGARFLVVAVRGDGRVTASAVGAGGAGGAGGAVRTIVATGAWRDLRVPVAAGAGPVTLAVALGPGVGPLAVADLGLVVRQAAFTGVTVDRSGRRVVVRGRLVPAGAGLVVTLSDPSGRRLAAARSGPTGRFRLVARTPLRAAVVATAGDRTRLGARRALRLPAAPPRTGGPPPTGRRSQSHDMPW